MKKVIVELANGGTLEVFVDEKNWDEFYEWLEDSNDVDHYEVYNSREEDGVLDMLKEEIDARFESLGDNRGFESNIADIKRWRDAGRISDAEYHELRSYNRKKYHELPIK